MSEGGREEGAPGLPDKLPATIAGGRPRFPTEGYICDMALFDLVAVNAISARHATVEILRGFRVAVIDLPITIEVPVSFAHAVDRPASIEREPRDPVRTTSNRPIGTPSSSAGVLIFIATRENIPFAHVLRRTVIAVVVFLAHRPFVDVEADIEALVHESHQARSEIDAPLQEARRWSEDGDGIDQVVAAQRRRTEEPIVFGSVGSVPVVLAQSDKATLVCRVGRCVL